MRVYDTLSRNLQTVEPMDGSTLRFYCCGPTVYGAAHIGNFRTFLMQDVFRRTVEASGVATKHVRNLTDVDDKTIRQSQTEGKTLKAFTDFWTSRFHEDCQKLNLLPPAVEPSAVEHIPQQIKLIGILIDKGVAYERNGSVYYRVSAFPDYGKLSRLKEREITTTPVAADANPEDADEYVRDSAADFALWKARRPEDGPNFWPSPWGEGRPGWHIECSAMSMTYLGESFDLHSGGVDLIFPHHENEIAQSEAATGKTFSRLWLHVAHLLVNGKKMSKSLGNLFTLDDVIKQGYSPAELRYVLISGHYRQELNYTANSLGAARSALERFAKFDKLITAKTGDVDAKESGPLGEFTSAWEALTEDLNTAKALGDIFVGLRKVEENFAQRSSEDLKNCVRGWKKLLYALGLELPTSQAVEIPQDIRSLAEERWNAKNAKNWTLADTLRKQLTEKGWSMRDGKSGYDLTPV